MWKQDRSLTPAEVAEVTRVLEPPRVDRATLFFTGLGLAIPGVGMAALIVALAFNLHLLPSRALLIVLMAVTGLIAVLLLGMAALRWFQAIGRTGAPKPEMTELRAKAMRVTEVWFDVDRRLTLLTADADVPWELFDAGDVIVSVQSSMLDEIWDMETKGPMVDDWRERITVVFMNESVRWIRQSGKLLPRDDREAFEPQGKLPGWVNKEFAILTRQQLWPELIARLDAGTKTG